MTLKISWFHWFQQEQLSIFIQTILVEHFHYKSDKSNITLRSLTSHYCENLPSLWKPLIIVKTYHHCETFTKKTSHENIPTVPSFGSFNNKCPLDIVQQTWNKCQTLIARLCKNWYKFPRNCHFQRISIPHKIMDYYFWWGVCQRPKKSKLSSWQTLTRKSFPDGARKSFLPKMRQKSVQIDFATKAWKSK